MGFYKCSDHPDMGITWNYYSQLPIKFDRTPQMGLENDGGAIAKQRCRLGVFIVQGKRLRPANLTI